EREEKKTRSYVLSTPALSWVFSRHICYHPCNRFVFERLETFLVCAGMVRGPEFRLSVQIPRRHQTALRGLAGACSQVKTAWESAGGRRRGMSARPARKPDGA